MSPSTDPRYIVRDYARHAVATSPCVVRPPAIPPPRSVVIRSPFGGKTERPSRPARPTRTAGASSRSCDRGGTMDDRVRALVERALEAAGPDDDTAFREWTLAFLADNVGAEGDRDGVDPRARLRGGRARRMWRRHARGARAGAGARSSARRSRRGRSSTMRSPRRARRRCDRAGERRRGRGAVHRSGGRRVRPPARRDLREAREVEQGQRTRGGGLARRAGERDPRTDGARVVEARMKLREAAESDGKKSPMPTKTSIRGPPHVRRRSDSSLR